MNPDNSISVLDHGFVRLDDAMADDLSVANAARVSFARRKEVLDESDEGLIRFLMRDRHGCYDDATDVLTADGWKAWPDVTGDELFATRTRDGLLTYEPALRLVRKEYRGHMIGFSGMSIDLLVTPDHRVLVSELTTHAGRSEPTFRLRPAHSVLWKAHRHTTAASWAGRAVEHVACDGTNFLLRPLLRLLGLFIGDGNLSPRTTCIVFNIRKDREIDFLTRAAFDSGLELRLRTHALAIQVGPELRALFAACYDGNREKVIPRRLLDLAPDLLAELYQGLLASDGTTQSRRWSDRETYLTTSSGLADQVQELALKLGRSASVRPYPARPGDGHYGATPRFRVTIYNERNLNPGLCRTRSQAEEQMGVENYDGLIHCVEVPSHTLYVRRNGYPTWSGNTPFEHNAFRFHIRCPIFVAREWFRHRIGCLTGDTVVTFVDSNGDASNRLAKTIDELWRMWTVDKTVASMRLRVLNESTGEFTTGRLTDVIDKGVQPVYTLTLADGKALTVTENHWLLTSDGWKRMRDAVGLVGDAELARVSHQCALLTNGVVTTPDRLTADGTEGESDRSRRGFTLRAHPVAVASVSYVGLRQTYDLSVAGPWHNFVANGVVVHNSFNEFSLRYAMATDDFYVPAAEDVRTQVGKPGAYTFEPVDPELAERTREELKAVYEQAFATYERLVEAGVARELARSALPVGAYTQFYWTLNARALMNFVSLRNSEFAQLEIRRYGEAVEAFLAEKMPVTYAAFVANGRIAP